MTSEYPDDGFMDSVFGNLERNKQPTNMILFKVKLSGDPSPENPFNIQANRSTQAL